MANFVGKDVVVLAPGITPETLKSDEDYYTGRITGKVLNKVRIVWSETKTVEYVEIGRLTKFDVETYLMRAEWGNPDEDPTMQDKTPETDETDNATNKAEAAETAIKFVKDVMSGKTDNAPDCEQ